jgi:ABC-type transport system involved in multi-copper enzyme maturation permease subunit
MTSTVLPVVYGTLLCLVQFLAALPWLAALDPDTFRAYLRRPVTWAWAVAGLVVGGVILAVVLNVIGDRERLVFWGRPYGALLEAQLLLDLFVIVFGLMLLAWPKGAAVALAAFREGVRQPMFWMLTGFGVLFMTVSPFIPYFTFGEDYKMLKELGYAVIMLLAIVFAVLAAAMSISEEIEGRTAITLMSKPVSRRQFLLGKFFGNLLAALLMTGILAWCFVIVLWFKPWYDNEPLPTPAWVEAARQAYTAVPESVLNFGIGAGEWLDIAAEVAPGVIIGFCQVMVLLAIAVALATRLPMVVNLVTCLVIYFLGHLSPVLVAVSEGKFRLVNFMAQFVNILLPGLEFYNLSMLIARDTPPPTGEYLKYVGSVTGYAVLYSAMALLFGLILFEDRDLA